MPKATLTRCSTLFAALGVAAAGLTAPSAALAGRVPMDPLNRIHVGFSAADGATNMGVMAGLDSRLTRLIHVDAGLFVSADPAEKLSINPRTADPKTFYSLRHGVYVTPGLRVPHRYGDGFNWDFIGRGGFGVIWAADSSQEQQSADVLTVSEAALCVGADLLLRYDKVGVRFSGKGFGFQTYAPAARQQVAVIRPQVGVELMYQF